MNLPVGVPPSHLVLAVGHHLMGQLQQADDSVLGHPFPHEGHGVAPPLHVEGGDHLWGGARHFLFTFNSGSGLSSKLKYTVYIFKVPSQVTLFVTLLYSYVPMQAKNLSKNLFLFYFLYSISKFYSSLFVESGNILSLTNPAFGCVIKNS